MKTNVITNESFPTPSRRLSIRTGRLAQVQKEDPRELERREPDELFAPVNVEPIFAEDSDSSKMLD